MKHRVKKRHWCTGALALALDCRESKHSLLPDKPSKRDGCPTPNYSSADDENKQQSSNGRESVSKAKQTCHSVKDCSPTICPSRCTKDFPKATVTRTAAGTHKDAIKCQHLLKQIWQTPPPAPPQWHLFLRFPLPALFTSFSMSVHLTNMLPLEESNSLTEKLYYSPHP